jgi:sec-independent protein translocase protein TatC
MVMPDEDALSPAGAGLGFGLTPSQRANPEARMPLMEHIRELRNRVVKIIVALFIGSVAGWFLFGRVFQFIERPYCRLPNPATAFGGHTCTLYVTGLFDAFFLKIQVAIAVGVILTSPFWFYQLWAFIAPGLYRRERRWAYMFVGAAVPLFLIGATIAYFAMTKGIHFLLGQVPHGVDAIITIDTYLSYTFAMIAIFGVAFELPLIFVLLNLAGVMTHNRFRKWRRMIIFLVFAFSAFFTPSPDPISMLLLAMPCVILIEAAEVFAWVHDRRKARNGSMAYPGLTAQEVAQFGLDKPIDELDTPAGHSTNGS